jgi:hypothetical protein
MKKAIGTLAPECAVVTDTKATKKPADGPAGVSDLRVKVRYARFIGTTLLDFLATTEATCSPHRSSARRFSVSSFDLLYVPATPALEPDT